MGLTNSEVAHKWAQLDPNASGRSNNGNFSFTGREIFSYSTVMGSYIEHKGKLFVFYNAEKYSVTTSTKHQSHIYPGIFPREVCFIQVWDAHISDERKTRVASHTIIERITRAFSMSDKQGLRSAVALVAQSLSDKAGDSMAYAARARTSTQRHLSDAQDYAEQAELLSSFFRVKSLLKNTSFNLEELREKTEKAQKAQKEKAKREKRERRQKEKENFDEWMTGKRDSCPPSYRTDISGSVYVRAKNGQLQTSMGVRAPLDEAIKVFRFASLCRKNSRPWERGDHTLSAGTWQIDSIDSQGNMMAGCHKFSFERMNELAVKLGVQ